MKGMIPPEKKNEFLRNMSDLREQYEICAQVYKFTDCKIVEKCLHTLEGGGEIPEYLFEEILKKSRNLKTN